MMNSLLMVTLLAAVMVGQYHVQAMSFQDLQNLVNLFNETEPIEVEMCKSVEYSRTTKKNFFGISQKAAEGHLFVKALMYLDKIGCTSIAKPFTCALVAPKPLDIYGAAPPCRSICESIEKSCGTLIHLLQSIRQGDCKKDVVGRKYRGKVNKTRNGLQCQKWSSQVPHAHRFTPEQQKVEGLSENYCRNPDREQGGPWCYTTDAKRRWEYCDVPLCERGFNMMCHLLPSDGCMDLKGTDDSDNFKMMLKGKPSLLDLVDFTTKALLFINRFLGSE